MDFRYNPCATGKAGYTVNIYKKPCTADLVRSAVQGTFLFVSDFNLLQTTAA